LTGRFETTDRIWCKWCTAERSMNTEGVKALVGSELGCRFRVRFSFILQDDGLMCEMLSTNFYTTKQTAPSADAS
jgi:hypothetical protein